MKILHLSSWKTRCGIAGFTESVVDHLSRLGVENEVFPLDVAELQSKTTAEFQQEMDRFVRLAAGSDLVHVQHEFGFFTGSGSVFETIAHFAYLLEALEAAERPVVVTFHSGVSLTTMLPLPEVDRDLRSAGGAAAFLQWAMRKTRFHWAATKLDKFWRKHISRHFDGRPRSFRGVVHSARTRMEMIGSGMAPQCVSVVPLGCELREPSFPKIDRAQAKAKLGLAPDAILLTIFGFVTAYKGHLPAVQALKKLPKQYHLAIVGGPHPENSIDRTLNSVLEAWEGENPARLIVTGYVPRETVDLYHAAGDICLAPFLAVNPTGSASITWALTSGRPTIASNIPAFADIQAESDCLLLCMPGAVHELAWQIQSLAADPPLQHRLAQNAMRFCEQNSWARVVQRLLAVYQQMSGLPYQQAGAAQQTWRHAA